MGLNALHSGHIHPAPLRLKVDENEEDEEEGDEGDEGRRESEEAMVGGGWMSGLVEARARDNR